VLEKTDQTETGKQQSKSLSHIVALEEKLTEMNIIARDSQQALNRLQTLKIERKQQTAETVEAQRQIAVLSEKLAQTKIAVLEKELRNTEANASGIRMVQMLEAQSRTMI